MAPMSSAVGGMEPKLIGCLIMYLVMAVFSSTPQYSHQDCDQTFAKVVGIKMTTTAAALQDQDRHQHS